MAIFGREFLGVPEALEKQGRTICKKFAGKFADNFPTIRQTKDSTRIRAAEPRDRDFRKWAKDCFESTVSEQRKTRGVRFGTKKDRLGGAH